ncbi:DUF4272 domain-containing protein [Defluviitalea phaphyphila]|uniref:DUF4272 domain-containing protein n=1 Tax=Defluviitalea phaphyphila TaxID=1473580 RepID=UPI001FA80D57|nr:DUF4272 domain-containing protein [Defluviitalea phaphyphila]
MKDAKEIIVRAIILLCVSDRCALEKSIIGGINYSKKQREDQRLAIYRWLKNRRYVDMMTKSEKLLFEQELGIRNKNEILFFQLQYEAIEPCLWTLGLVQNLSNYDKFVLTDFHSVLQIDMNHTLEKVLSIVNLRSETDIKLQKEISMLWHWRAIEYNNPIFKVKSVKDMVKEIFGDTYEQVLENIPQFDNNKNDFIVNGKPFINLSIKEKKIINCIAQWRHHAFEWIVGNESWDKVEINT